MGWLSIYWSSVHDVPTGKKDISKKELLKITFHGAKNGLKCEEIMNFFLTFSFILKCVLTENNMSCNYHVTFQVLRIWDKYICIYWRNCWSVIHKPQINENQTSVKNTNKWEINSIASHWNSNIYFSDIRWCIYGRKLNPGFWDCSSSTCWVNLEG